MEMKTTQRKMIVMFLLSVCLPLMTQSLTVVPLFLKGKLHNKTKLP